MIPILILAAGQSKRMRGADKLMEDVGGVPLVVQQAKVAMATGNPVFVALPDHTHPRGRALGGFPVTKLALPEASEGMASTLRAGVARLPVAPAFMVMLGDLVALETHDLSNVLAARIDFPGNLIWRGATEDGKPGHPILFDGSLKPKFQKLSGDGGGEGLVSPLRDQTYLVPLAGNRARLDLDTPEEWAAWRAATG